MKKTAKRKTVSKKKEVKPVQVSVPEKPKVNLEELMNKLNVIEKKLDTLIIRPSGSGPSRDSFRADLRPRNFDRPRERSFTKAICAECGQECEVPFKPSGDRPVYCQECFSARKDSGHFKGKHGHKKGQFR